MAAEGSLVDWDLAEQTARRLVRPGPEMARDEVLAVVDELREGASRSEGPVREFTGLHARSSSAPVLVVDRAGWTKANVEGFRGLLEPFVDRLAAQESAPQGVARTVTAKVSGAELGGLLGFLSHKVLGQFDPFWDGGPGTSGRMLLVAPTIVSVERELGVDPHDFRLWVCLHEETHRVQFTAVPWLRDHVGELITRFTESAELEPESLSRTLADGLATVGRMARGTHDGSLLDLLQNAEQRAVVDSLTGVMSLLEGHADVVMDGVGPEVVPSVEAIRQRFSQRRRGGGLLDLLVRRVMGLDAKLRQYRDGAAFVRTVVDRVGHDGFNAVWVSPDHLPTRDEIVDPGLWVARVHG